MGIFNLTRAHSSAWSGKSSAWSESSTWSKLANQLLDHDQLRTTLSLCICSAYTVFILFYNLKYLINKKDYKLYMLSICLVYAEHMLSICCLLAIINI